MPLVAVARLAPMAALVLLYSLASGSGFRGDLVGFAVGLAFGAAQMFAARGKWDGGFRFHFGPYLAIAGVVALFWGGPVMRWWLAGL